MDAAACSVVTGLVKVEKRQRGKRHTASLDALDGGIRDCSIDGLSGLLESVDSRLLEARIGAEEAGVADDV